MHQFTDTVSRVWQVAITVGSVQRVRGALKVNLLNPIAAKPRKVRGEDRKGVPLVTRLQLDPCLLVNVLFVLVQRQAEERGVTDEQFGEALGGEAAWAAYEAFMAEWQSFFRGLRREAEAKAIAANLALVQSEGAKDVAVMDRATEAASRVAEQNRQEVLKKLDALGRGPSETATDSPELSESTPPS